MTNDEVVNRFFEHKSGKSLHMRTDGVKLYSYSTCMAEWHDGILYINTTKYSATTSKQLYHFRARARYMVTHYVDGADYGVYSIYSFYLDTDKTFRAKRGREKKFHDFIKEVDMYTKTVPFSYLSAQTKEKVRNLKDTSRCNSYRKQMQMFCNIRKNINGNGISALIQRCTIRRDSEPQSFCF